MQISLNHFYFIFDLTTEIDLTCCHYLFGLSFVSSYEYLHMINFDLRFILFFFSLLLLLGNDH